jgi:hypothetical protein
LRIGPPRREIARAELSAETGKSMHSYATKRLVAVVAIVAFAAFAPLSPARADDTALAKAKFQEGMSQIQGENYPAALAAFDESYKLVPKPGLLYNIGMCQKALFRYVESVATFRKYLADGGANVKPEMKAAAEQSIADMLKLVGTVSVEGAPDGAEVFVDDKPVGKTPFKEQLMVDPGGHSIRVAHDGYKPLRAEVTVPQGAAISVSAKLQSVAAWIKISCEAKDAIVHLDGKVVGGCPYEGEVQPGAHEVKVQEPGKPAFLQKFDVASGGTATVAVTLQTGAPAGPSPEQRKKARALKIAGIATMAVGAGAGVLGLVFNLKGMKDEKKAEDAVPNSNERAGLNDDIQVDKAVMIAGYAAAGAFVVAGVVLVALSAKGESQEQKVAIAPAPGGLAVSF